MTRFQTWVKLPSKNFTSKQEVKIAMGKMFSWPSSIFSSTFERSKNLVELFLVSGVELTGVNRQN